MKQLLIHSAQALTVIVVAGGGTFALHELMAEQTTVTFEQGRDGKIETVTESDTEMEQATQSTMSEPEAPAWPAPLAVAEYNERILALSGYESPAMNTVIATNTSSTATSSLPAEPQLILSSSTNTTIAGRAWPPATPLPHGGAILPFERIVAYYGNFYSTRMGILGEFASSTVLAQLASTSAAWEAADPNTPVRPAIHYIAMVAQADAGADGMYRNVMPAEHIEQAYDMAQEIDGIMFLDLQIGLSSLEAELPQFREYLTRPDVHLGLDPEFAMHTGAKPGTEIGSFSAQEINYAIDWLAEIVREHKLPPKVLVVHRFTNNMVRDAHLIEPRPEVQVVIDMDGWGSKDLKRNTYLHTIINDPVQFAGIKIFYKNDLKPPSTGIFTPEEVLEFVPTPIYIQYQ